MASKGAATGIELSRSSLTAPRVLKLLNRHRGGGHPPTPATPPCVRVRTRRFERGGNLTPIEQRRCRSGLRIQSSPGAIRALFLSFLGLHPDRSEEHTSELQSLTNLVCRLLLEITSRLSFGPSLPVSGSA